MALRTNKPTVDNIEAAIIESAVGNGWDTAIELKEVARENVLTPESRAIAREWAVRSIPDAIQCAEDNFGARQGEHRVWKSNRLSLAALEKLVRESI